MSKKVVLFNPLAFPPSDRGRMAKQYRKDFEPLPLLALTGPLIQAGYDTTIIDQVTDPDWRDTLLTCLKQEPVCIGITAMTGIQISYGLDASKIVKDNSSTPVVWGGIHATSLPEQTVTNQYIDIVVVGEGEETFAELVRALEHKEPLSDISGICYKSGNEIKRTKPRDFIDLNKHPPLPLHLLKHKNIQHLRIITSRGCPFQCRFCHNSRIDKHRWRALAATETLKTVEEFVKEYRNTVKGIRFLDSNFFVDQDRAGAIAEGLIKYQLPWQASGRIDTFLKADDAFINVLEKSRFCGLYMGVESGSQRILDFIRKDIKVSDAIAVNKRLSRRSFNITYQFMVGFPTETHTDIKQTLALIETLLNDNDKAKKNINIYTPYPETDLFDIALAHGFRTPDKLEDWAKHTFKSAIDRPWLDMKTKRLIEMMLFCSIFLEKNRFEKHSLSRFIAHLYRPVARLRLKNLFSGFPVEIILAKHLGFTG